MDERQLPQRPSRRSRGDDAAATDENEESAMRAHGPRRGTAAEAPSPKRVVPPGMTAAPANTGVTGTQFVISPEATVSSVASCSTPALLARPISRSTPSAAGGGSRNVSVFGLQAAAAPARPSAFAMARNHATGQRHWPRAEEEVPPTPVRPESSTLNDWDAKPPVPKDAARELALRLGAMKI